MRGKACQQAKRAANTCLHSLHIGKQGVVSHQWRAVACDSNQVSLTIKRQHHFHVRGKLLCCWGCRVGACIDWLRCCCSCCCCYCQHEQQQCAHAPPLLMHTDSFVVLVSYAVMILAPCGVGYPLLTTRLTGKPRADDLEAPMTSYQTGCIDNSSGLLIGPNQQAITA